MRLIKKVLADSNSVVLSYYGPKQEPIMGMVRRVIKESGAAIERNEGYQLYTVTRNTAKVPGDIAEVGTYTGGSSSIIGEAKGDRALHLFDTFEGLPDNTQEDGAKEHFFTGMYAASLEEVQKRMQGIPNVHFYKGLFPSTAGPVADKKFSFVHLDVDLYVATKDSLEFFYPRMSKGGVLISHDYINAPGVIQAFTEFFADKPEPLIEMSGSQVLFVKL